MGAWLNLLHFQILIPFISIFRAKKGSDIVSQKNLQMLQSFNIKVPNEYLCEAHINPSVFIATPPVSCRHTL